MFLTTREKLALLALMIVIFLSLISFIEIRNPDQPYLQRESYCQYDTDCSVVYSLIANKCLTVNNFHRSKYDQDQSCRIIEPKCIKKTCNLE